MSTLSTVEEAVKLNRSLMSVNKHQQCVINQLRHDTASLRSQLVGARAAAQQGAGGGPETLQQRDQVNRLKVKVTTVRQPMHCVLSVGSELFLVANVCLFLK